MKGCLSWLLFWWILIPAKLLKVVFESITAIMPPLGRATSSLMRFMVDPQGRKAKTLALIIVVAGIGSWVLASSYLRERHLNSLLSNLWSQAQSAERAGSYGEAIRYFDEILRLQPTSTEAQWAKNRLRPLALGEERYKNGVALFEKGDFVAAASSLGQLASDHPRYLEAQQTLQHATTKAQALMVQRLGEAERQWRSKKVVGPVRDMLSSIDLNFLPANHRPRYERLNAAVSREEAAIAELAERQVNLYLRQQFAEEVERIFLGQGWDVHVSLEGRDMTTLRMKYILWSRPLVYQFTQKVELIANFRKLGFKKLIFDGGYYRGEWVVDLR